VVAGVWAGMGAWHGMTGRQGGIMESGSESGGAGRQKKSMKNRNQQTVNGGNRWAGRRGDNQREGWAMRAKKKINGTWQVRRKWHGGTA